MVIYMEEGRKFNVHMWYGWFKFSLLIWTEVKQKQVLNSQSYIYQFTVWTFDFFSNFIDLSNFVLNFVWNLNWDSEQPCLFPTLLTCLESGTCLLRNICVAIPRKQHKEKEVKLSSIDTVESEYKFLDT